MPNVEIGRLTLKVTPDTSGFRREVQREADAIEKSLDEIQVDLEIDGDKARRQAKQVKSQVEKDFDDLEATVKLDGDKASAEAKKLAERIKRAVDGINADIELEDEKVLAEAKALGKALKRAIQSEKPEVDISLRADGMMAKLQTVIADIKAKTAKDAEIGLRVNPVMRSVATAWAKMQAAVPPLNTKLVLKVEEKAGKAAMAALMRSSGMRIVWEFHKKKMQAAANFDQLALKASVAAIAVTNLGSAIIAVSGNILSWGKDIASVSALLLPLPGILAGVGLGLWSVMNGLKSFSKQLPGVASQWEAMTAAMDAKFWETAKKPLQDMADNLLPKFSAGMQRVSQESGRLVGALATGLSKYVGPRLNGMMTNLASSIKIASGAMDGLSKGLSVMLDKGMQMLPGMAREFTNLTTKFGNWMTEIEGNGTLDAWIRNGTENLKAFGSIIWSTGRIFKGLADAAQAAGASTLKSLSDTMQRAADVVQSGPFQAALTNFLTGIYAFTNSVGAAIGRLIASVASAWASTLSSSLAALGPVIASNIDALARGLTSSASVKNLGSMFDGLRNGLKSLEPAFEAVGEKATIVGDLIGSAFENLAPLINSMVTELAGVLETLQGPLNRFFDAVGPVANELFQTFAPALEHVAQKAGELLDDHITPLVKDLDKLKPAAETAKTALWALADVVEGTLGPALDGLKDRLPEIEGSFKSFNTELEEFLSHFGIGPKAQSGGGGEGDGPLQSAIRFLSGTAIGQALQPVKTLTTALQGLNALINSQSWQNIGKNFREFDFGKLFDFGEMGERMRMNIARLGTEITAGFLALKGIIIEQARSMGGDTLAGFAEGLMSFASMSPLQAITTVIMGVINTAKSLLGIQSPSTVFIQIGSDTIQGLIDGLVGMIGALMGAIGTVVGSVITALSGVGSAILSGLGSMVQGGIDFVIGIVNSIATIGSSMFTSISTSIQGMADSIASKWDSLKTTASTKWSEINTQASTWWESIKTTVTAKVDGMIAAVGNKWSEIKTSASAAWSSLTASASAAWAGLTATVSSFASSLVARVTSAWASLRARTAAAWASIKAAASAAVSSMASAISAKISGMVGRVTSLFSSLRARAVAQLSSMRAQAASIVSALVASFSSRISALPGIASRIFSAVRSAVTSMMTQAKNKVSQIAGQFATALSSKYGAVYSAAVNLGRGALNGLASIGSSIIAKAREIASSVASAMSSVWEIRSPSRLMIRMARYLGEGLIIGLDDKQDAVVKAAMRVAHGVADVPFQLSEVNVPNYARYNNAAIGASGVVSMAAGTVINQTFNAADMNSADVASELSFTMRQMSMAGHYQEGL